MARFLCYGNCAFLGQNLLNLLSCSFVNVLNPSTCQLFSFLWLVNEVGFNTLLFWFLRNFFDLEFSWLLFGMIFIFPCLTLLFSLFFFPLLFCRSLHDWPILLSIGRSFLAIILIYQRNSWHDSSPVWSAAMFGFSHVLLLLPSQYSNRDACW